MYFSHDPNTQLTAQICGISGTKPNRQKNFVHVHQIVKHLHFVIIHLAIGSKLNSCLV